MVSRSRSLKTLLIFTALIVSACSSDKGNKTSVSQISAAAVLSSSSPASEKAETLALQAEELFAANGIMEASRVAKLALKEDPKNTRAQFLNALMNPFIVAKGVFARLKPLMSQIPSQAERHQEEMDKIESDPKLTANFKSFILEGEADIKTEEQAQVLLDQLVQSLADLRMTLKGLNQAEITLKANPVLVPDLNDRYAAACEITETANLEYELKCPPSEGRNKVTVNQGDFEMFRLMAAVYEIFISSHNAYDVTGLMKVLSVFDLSGQPAKFAGVFPELLKNPKAGKLRPQNQLRKIKEMGVDFVVAARWMSNNYASLCKTGNQEEANRPGMWIYKGICLNPQYFMTYIKEVESHFSDDQAPFQATKNGNMFTTKINSMSLFEKPVSDLRQLGPFQFDKCGQLRRVGDPTLGGVFPYRNANEALTFRLEECAE